VYGGGVKSLAALGFGFALAVCSACGSGTVEPPADSGPDAPRRLDASAEAPPDAVVDASIPHYTIDLASTSVSGLSSGGFMAVQFHVAFSSIMKGAAIFAGGPYMCSQGSQLTAISSCSQASPAPDVAACIAATNQNAQSGDIDDPSALAAQHVFLWGGADDTVVKPAVMDALDSYYAAFVPSGSIDYVSRAPGASHTWPTLDYGVPCDVVTSPYVGKCNYDGAGAALAQIYGSLAPAATAPTGAIVPIPQAAFITDPASHSLGDTAYLYVPAACAAGETCKIHVSFHGCLQYADAIGDSFYAHSGLNEWADTNHIVVLYPQTTVSTPNPEGCWDFWGYDSPDFAKKTGPQMAMVRAMIDALAQ
jgi:poly(3-hydroxybutyrate) depolymerase